MAHPSANGPDEHGLFYWPGGKRAYRNEIVRQFPIHVTYVEVFAGAAWVLFAKPRISSRVEIINDLHGDIANLFRCVRDRTLELEEKLRWCVLSQEDFERTRDHCKEGFALTEVDRAAKFVWRLRSSFSGRGAHFGYDLASFNGPTPMKLIGALRRYHKRLERVYVFNEDFERLITRLDRPETFFYADPPYCGSETEYEVTFSEGDHVRLADALKNLSGKFLLSYNDHPTIRELYAWATIEEVTTRYSISRKAETRGTERRELLIRNNELTQAVSTESQ